MKLLWLCNMAPGVAREKVGAGGLWIDHVLSDLRQRDDLTIRVLFPGNDGRTGNPDQNFSFASFRSGLPYVYLPEVETYFSRELAECRPDVIHIWGTEYAHTLAMVNAAEKAKMLDHLVISIQGLCSEITKAYADGVPEQICRRSTLRDFLREDNIARQQKKFALRGELEVQALRKVRHVIGRTRWDKAVAAKINPDAVYHLCNETLRDAFYEGNWQYQTCRKHRIFSSSCDYPVKGFHYLLEAFSQVLKKYPDATLAVPGKGMFANSLREKLRQDGYRKYLVRLAKKYALEDNIQFLGRLDAEQMKKNFLEANIFVLPSTIENSPNSLGEAMLLGVPCVAADVGGVTSMLNPEEGWVYRSPEHLADCIDQAFSLGQEAEKKGAAAKAHAQKTHDPKINLETLLSIYEQLQ